MTHFVTFNMITKRNQGIGAMDGMGYTARVETTVNRRDWLASNRSPVVLICRDNQHDRIGSLERTGQANNSKMARK